MALSSLGKRTRSSHEESELPLKRPRRQTRNFVVVNDENQDPQNVSFEDALVASVSETPSKPRRHVSSTSSSPLKSSPLKQSPAKAPLTPSTPRFRNGLASTKTSAAAAASPQTPPLTPVTPRHRVMSAGKLSRRMTPHGANTPTTPAGCQTIYHKARQLFSRSAGTGSLIGREEERSRLQSFLRINCENPEASAEANGCLYVSGPPGTGKSAMVNEVTEELCSGLSSVRKAYINCMSIRSSNDLYNTLLRLLLSEDDGSDGSEVADMNETDAINTLQTMFVPKKKAGRLASSAAAATATTYLVVLDEIDHILTLDLESLYRVLGWSMTKASRLVLVGIANALDLTDRFLPRLKSRNLQPELLPFLPYTAPQIKNIVMTRLRSLVPTDSATDAKFLPFFHPVAIELCSRKVASQTGDLRKAFEILRRALDLVEAEAKEKCMSEAREAAGQQASLTITTPTKKRPLGENMNLATSSPTKSVGLSSSGILAAWAQSLTIESAPRVSIGHLNKVTAAAFGNGAQQRLRGLNLQQKAALCALTALEKWNRQAHAQQMQKTGVPAKLSKLGKGVKVPGAGSPAKAMRAGASAAPTIKMLFDTYCRMCKRDAVLHPLSSSEFREVVGSLETLSLVTAVDGRTGSFAVLQSMPGSGGGRRRRGAGAGGETTGVLAGDEKQVASCVGEKELQQALEGAGADILQTILSGEVLD